MTKFGRLFIFCCIASWIVAGSVIADVPYYGVFAEAPPTSIQPQGWLREMLRRQADGLASHHAVSGYPFNTCLWAGTIPVDRNPKSKAWWPYEQTGYLVDGLERLGLVTDDSAILSEADANVQYILTHPKPDGSLGPDGIGPTNWPHAVVFRAMMASYAAHPNPEIPAALLRHFLTRPTDFGAGRDVCNVESILWTYAHTSDPRLLTLAQRTYDNFNRTNPKTALTALYSGQPIIEHGVTFNETAKIPAVMYLYNGEKSLLDASINAYHMIDRQDMLASGLHSAQERLAGNDPWNYHETCDISDYTWSVGYLLMATGDCTWADHIEKTVFNAGFGAITKDFKAHQYFSSPNQIVAADGICKKYNPNRLAYRPGHDVECCSGNVHRFLPNFALRQWLVTPSGGIVAALYAPSRFNTSVNGTLVTIDEITDYPFSESIQFVIRASKPVPLSLWLRLPGWTSVPSLRLNNAPLTNIGNPGTFTEIRRIFADGDTLTLNLPMTVKIQPWPNHTVSIERGPLVYSLKITEDATAIHDSGTNPDFPVWNKRPASPWNYSLKLSAADSSVDQQIKVSQHPRSGCPWDTSNAPVELQASAETITNWTLPPDGSNPGFPAHPAFSEKMQPVTLVPYGSTCLRLTVFPLADEQP